jgi:uncharacterized protein YcfJ
MRKFIALTALAAAISLPLIAGPTAANAGCQSRKNTGTLIGGVGGALLGNSISHGGGGAIIGGLGGAVVGHEIAKGGCGSARQASYRHSRSRYPDERGRNRYSDEQAYSGTRKVYYDQYGNALLSPPPAYNR